MKSSQICLALLFLVQLSAGLRAADPIVSNVLASQRADSKLVDIYYDLAYDGENQVEVAVEVSEDGGVSFEVPAETLTGAYGRASTVTPGSALNIVWNAGSDWNQRYTEKAMVRVVATEFVPPETPPAPEGFALIPAGTYLQGSPSDEPGRYSNETQRYATLTQGFYLSTTEVTWSQWNAARLQASSYGYTDIGAGRNGYNGDAGGAHPVTEVSWWDVVKWCNLRSEIEGKTPVYYTSASFGSGNVLRTGSPTPYADWSADGYRLPTEAEWEYACRSGTTTAFHTGGISYTGTSPVDPNLDLAGWYGGNSGSNTHPVAQKQANAWGLYDMHGNVWEWCWDWYGSSYGGDASDPKGAASGSYRVNRGGSWNDYARNCRSANRNWNTPTNRNYFIGFRVALSSNP